MVVIDFDIFIVKDSERAGAKQISLCHMSTAWFSVKTTNVLKAQLSRTLLNLKKNRWYMVYWFASYLG